MTGDDVADPTVNPLWLGEPLPLDLESAGTREVASRRSRLHNRCTTRPHKATGPRKNRGGDDVHDILGSTKGRVWEPVEHGTPDAHSIRSQHEDSVRRMDVAGDVGYAAR
ncbi:hypothetical protein BH11MYX4_BH11MYX4_07130 [soil metagenome]